LIHNSVPYDELLRKGMHVNNMMQLSASKKGDRIVAVNPTKVISGTYSLVSISVYNVRVACGKIISTTLSIALSVASE
jgi:hypothetical protein